MNNKFVCKLDNVTVCLLNFRLKVCLNNSNHIKATNQLTSNCNSNLIISLNYLSIHCHYVLLCKWVISWGHSCSWVCSQRSSEKKNEWLRLVNFIMSPTSRLLDSDWSPFLFCKDSVSRYLLIDMLWEQNVSIFK